MADEKVPRVLRMDIDEVDAVLLLILLGQEDAKNNGNIMEQIAYAARIDTIRTVRPQALTKVSEALQAFFDQEKFDAAVKEILGGKCSFCGGVHKEGDHPPTDAKSAQAE